MKTYLIILFAMILTACGGGGGGSSTPVEPTPPIVYTTDLSDFYFENGHTANFEQKITNVGPYVNVGTVTVQCKVISDGFLNGPLPGAVHAAIITRADLTIRDQITGSGTALGAIWSRARIVPESWRGHNQDHYLPWDYSKGPISDGEYDLTVTTTTRVDKTRAMGYVLSAKGTTIAEDYIEDENVVSDSSQTGFAVGLSNGYDGITGWKLEFKTCKVTYGPVDPRIGKPFSVNW